MINFVPLFELRKLSDNSFCFMDIQNKRVKLFSEFPPVSTTEWEEKIKADLKGAEYEKKLIWKTDEGFPVRPYYRSEDLRELSYLNGLPGEAPFVRGVKKENNNWIIRQDIATENIEEANRIALDAVEKGADAIGFRVKEITTHKQMSQLLKGIDLEKTKIDFISSRSYPLTLELFIYEINHRALDGSKVSGSMNFDPISFLLLTGDFYNSLESNLDEAEYLIHTLNKKLPNFRTVVVNGGLFSNAGATVVQELAFSLASANEYLNDLIGKGFSVDTVSQKMFFSFGIGSNYFMEIAKLRAARLLWAALVDQYKPEDPQSLKMFIHSTTSKWNKTIYDPYVNMLRTTTEGMSAILGNADSVAILPFDASYREDNNFSRRIARNQQLILKEEAYLDKIVDPSSGSYYIENLTHSIASHAWDKFRSIEDKGGFIECIKTGIIQDEITETCRKKEMDYAQRKTVVIGTNQYPNLNENMLDCLQTQASKATPAPSKYRKITPSRGTVAFENLRLATEKFVQKGNAKPKVFLLTIGNLAMRKARAAFSTNFFGCAGFEIIDNPGFETVEESIRAVKLSSPDFVVICSSDEEYATLGASLAEKLKKANAAPRVIIAGYPKELVESLKAAGVDEFIHMRSNILDTLSVFQKQVGIIKA
jgi:methylmalonyl-CoA mutase